MKTALIVLGTMALVVILIGAGVIAGAALFRGRWVAGNTPAWGLMGPGMMFDRGNEAFRAGGCTGGIVGPGEGVTVPCAGEYALPAGGGAEITLEEAATSVERYVARLGYGDLHLAEVMEFDRNYYVIVAEDDTDTGAMELLVDKNSGAVGPEPGPNMMWNQKYGMHRSGRMGMMGSYPSDPMRLSAQDAEAIAQQWLDANLPGRQAGEADAFYGYYTLHYLHDGEIEGMLSVHGDSGDVWYHSWHGSFIAMVGDHEEDLQQD